MPLAMRTGIALMVVASVAMVFMPSAATREARYRLFVRGTAAAGPWRWSGTVDAAPLRGAEAVQWSELYRRLRLPPFDRCGLDAVPGPAERFRIVDEKHPSIEAAWRRGNVRPWSSEGTPYLRCPFTLSGGWRFTSQAMVEMDLSRADQTSLESMEITAEGEALVDPRTKRMLAGRLRWRRVLRPAPWSEHVADGDVVEEIQTTWALMP